MPRISDLDGIKIYMYYEDHNPPHFHAIVGSREMVVGIQPVVILAGKLPAKMSKKVLAWATVHAAALMENWNRMQNGNEPNEI